jgi:hypothetical protein
MTNSTLNIQYASECEIPCIRIETRDHSEAGYLMPFRAYRFQVCHTVHGEGDMGASDVRDLRDAIRWMPDGNAINYLREQAMIAIMRWQPDEYGYGINMTDDDLEIFEDWMVLCYEWLKGKDTWKPEKSEK